MSQDLNFVSCESEGRSVVSNSLQVHGQSMEFSRLEYRCGQPFPSPEDLFNPGIEPRSSIFQVDSLPAEPPGKPKNTGMGGLSPLKRLFPTQGSSQSLLHGMQIICQLSYQAHGPSCLLQPSLFKSLFVHHEYWYSSFLLTSI